MSERALWRFAGWLIGSLVVLFAVCAIIGAPS